MHLAKVTVKNFRGLRELTVPLERGTTVLIGENNTGKSAFLLAIRSALTRSIAGRRGRGFEEYDHHLASPTDTPRGADELSITLRFAEGAVGEWSADLIQDLADAVVVSDNLRQITLRVTSRFDANEGDYVVDWRFLNAVDEELIGAAVRPGTFLAVIEKCPVFYLSAIRDAAREFTERGAFWGAFIRDPGIPEEARTRVQAALKQVNEELLAAHGPLKSAEASLGRLRSILPGGQAEAVSVNAVPAQIRDLLAETQVSVRGTGGLEMPLAQQGAGTQSLAVVLLFEAYASAFLTKAGGVEVSPLVEIEEPETHLHPGAIRAAWRAISGMGGQKLLATHSGDIVANAPLTSIRRFYLSGGQVRASWLKDGDLTDEEVTRVEFHVKAGRGELLFARCWLLVEGETEFWVFTAAGEQLGMNLEQEGVRIVPYRLSGAEPLLKAANLLGISWFLVADGDDSGKGSVSEARKQLAGKAEVEHVGLLPSKNMELLLCEAGLGGVYERHVSPQKRGFVTAAKDHPDYWSQVIKAQDQVGKPMKAQEVAKEMLLAGDLGVPEAIKEVLRATVRLARA